VPREDLYNPHTVATADFDGSGHPDIYVAEMGLDGYEDPTHYVLANPGDDSLAFETHVIERGVPTHEATVADVNADSRPDVVGKRRQPRRRLVQQDPPDPDTPAVARATPSTGDPLHGRPPPRATPSTSDHSTGDRSTNGGPTDGHATDGGE
jgi:hypothetical protein